MRQADQPYNEADLRRYCEGGMSPAEMHALEAAALNDPFLSDALEGYRATRPAAADLQDLQTALEARIRKDEKKKAPVFFLHRNKALRVAALLILIAGMGWVAYRLPFTGQKDIALQESQAAEKNNIDSITEKVVADSTTLTDNSSTPETVQPTVVETLTYSTKRRKAATTKAPIQQGKEIPQETLSIQAQKEMHNDTHDRVAEEIQRRAEATAVASAAPTVQRLSGRVVDNSGNAVPYASVTIRGNRSVAQTDTNGAFSITVPDSTAKATISAAGYQSNQAFLSPVAQNQVVLNRETSSLEEVVVSMKKPSARKKAVVTIVEGQLEPKEGWLRYNDYIAESLSEPEKLETKPVSGEVSLSFDVNDAGEPINIHIEKSLCPVCDLKAVRLLKEGPKWKPGKGRKGSIMIHF